VVLAALWAPYSCCWYRETLLPSAAGKLADEGTGDGVYDRRSANDLAARRFWRFCAALSRPDGEDGMSRRADAWRPMVENIAALSDRVSVKSMVVALVSPRL